MKLKATAKSHIRAKSQVEKDPMTKWLSELSPEDGASWADGYITDIETLKTAYKRLLMIVLSREEKR